MQIRAPVIYRWCSERCHLSCSIGLLYTRHTFSLAAWRQIVWRNDGTDVCQSVTSVLHSLVMDLRLEDREICFCADMDRFGREFTDATRGVVAFVESSGQIATSIDTYTSRSIPATLELMSTALALVGVGEVEISNSAGVSRTLKPNALYAIGPGRWSLAGDERSAVALIGLDQHRCAQARMIGALWQVSPHIPHGAAWPPYLDRDNQHTVVPGQELLADAIRTRRSVISVDMDQIAHRGYDRIASVPGWSERYNRADISYPIVLVAPEPRHSNAIAQRYVCRDGNRRLIKLKRLGMRRVQAVVYRRDEEESLAMSLNESIA